MVNVYITNWKDPPCLMGKLTINGYKWPFSIVMLVYRRVCHAISEARKGNSAAHNSTGTQPWAMGG